MNKTYYLLSGIIVSMVLFFNFAHAQKHSLKFQFQQGVSSIENTFVVKEYHALLGVEYDYKFSESNKIPFYISTGVNYYNTTSYLLKNANNFGIPLMMNLTFGKKVKMDIGVGVNYSILFSKKFRTPFLENNTSKDDFHVNAVGLISRIGLKYELKKKHKLGLYLTLLKNYTPTYTRTTTDHFGNKNGQMKYFINYFGVSVFYEMAITKE